jgi:hypothetical protein
MRKHLSIALSTLACASLLATTAVVLSACGDDDNGATNDGGGNDGTTNNDGSTTDGGDAGCNFATYVIGLINAPTPTPDTTLGQGCKDDQDQTEFKSLFP